MRNKELKKLLDRELENTFHMNEKADYAKKNLVFTKREPKVFMFNKAKFLTLSTAIVLASIGISSITTYAINQHINEERIKNDYIKKENSHDIVKEANDYLDKVCPNHSRYPLVTKNINSIYYLSIYDGYEYTTNNLKVILYFYQFGCYIADEFDIRLDFYVEPNNYKTEILSQNNTAPLAINNNLELSSLYVDVYLSNQLLTKLTLI